MEVELMKILTDKQRRRIEPYLNGASLTEIARREGVAVQSVRESIIAAKQRLRKRLSGIKTFHINRQIPAENP